MSFDEEQIKNKMVSAPPAKKEFHFSGDGIYHNLTILASTIEEANEKWLAQRRVLASTDTNATDLVTTQSTPASEPPAKSEVE